jgi:hypothetical protein
MIDEPAGYVCPQRIHIHTVMIHMLTAPVVAHIYASVGIHRRIAPVLAGIYASVTIYIHVLGRKNQWNAQSSLGRHKNETYVVRMYSNVCPYIDT